MELTPSFTEKLDFIPQSRRVAETFGWQPGIWGLLFIVAAGVSITLVNRSLPDISWLVFVCLAVLGLGLLAYEIRRRTHRTVLVNDNGHLLVFRKGRLDLVLEPAQVEWIQADFHTMLYIGVCLGLASALFIFLGITMLMKDRTGHTDAGLILFAGLCILASLASAIRTRFFCRHLRIPVRDSKWTEASVLIPASRYKALFP